MVQSAEQWRCEVQCAAEAAVARLVRRVSKLPVAVALAMTCETRSVNVCADLLWPGGDGPWSPANSSGASPLDCVFARCGRDGIAAVTLCVTRRVYSCRVAVGGARVAAIVGGCGKLRVTSRV